MVNCEDLRCSDIDSLYRPPSLQDDLMGFRIYRIVASFPSHLALARESMRGIRKRETNVTLQLQSPLRDTTVEFTAMRLLQELMLNPNAIPSMT